jgi:predicted ferric reductase
MQTYQAAIKPKLGWVIVTGLSLLPVLLYLKSATPLAEFGSYFDFLSSLGRMAGLAGAILYAINLILSTRLRLFEDYFGGLNRVYIAHHIIGGIALILLLFHPVLFSLRYLQGLSLASYETAAKFLLPRSLAGFGLPLNGEVRQKYAIDAALIAFLGMVVLLFITFFVDLRYQLWLFIHKFLGVAFGFAGIHILLIESDVAHNGFLRYYLLAFVVLGLISYTYRTLLGGILVRKYNYRVDQVNRVGNDVAELVMRPIEQAMPYQAGQFIFIRFRNDHQAISTEAHPFSISSTPGDDHLRIDAKALGDYTRSLLTLKPGAVAEIEGAYGRFSFQNYPNPNQLWIAGGIGITPFLSMARALKSPGPQVDLYYSVKSESEFVHQDTLAAIVPSGDNFRSIPWVSEKQGLLTAQKIAEVSDGITGKEVFICGPPPMMKALVQQFKALGVPRRRIHTEEFRLQ